MLQTLEEFCSTNINARPPLRRASGPKAYTPWCRFRKCPGKIVVRFCTITLLAFSTLLRSRNPMPACLSCIRGYTFPCAPGSSSPNQPCSSSPAGSFRSLRLHRTPPGRKTPPWRAEHKADLLKPDGWLSLAGLEWLQPGDNSVGSAAGDKIHLAAGPAHLAVLHLEGETVTLNPPAGGFPPDFLVAGAPAKSQSLRAEANNDKVSPHLTVGTLNMYVIRREARFALRIKDSHSPAD